MKIPTLLTMAVLTMAAVGVAAPAQAKDVDVKGTATCTTGIKGKIKAGPRDPGQIKTNVQVDDRGTVRRVWTVTVTDGTQTVTRQATTRGASNSINLDFFTKDNAGSDEITFTATRAGASCSGSVTVP